MTQQELTIYNIGQNLDDLMNLDPRGYGVCRILYDAARERTGVPLCMNAARQLAGRVHEGDIVHIITGFVLLPHKRGEMDGMVGSVMLARALVKAYGAKPIIIVPEDCVEAVRRLSRVAGLHLYDSISEILSYPISMAVIAFTKDATEATGQADAIIAEGRPAAVISIEAPGANALGRYHNAVGCDVTQLEAKADVLFERLQQLGVISISIGDLGNEIGMGAIADQLDRYIPYAAKGRCDCGCAGGIAAATKADHLITATVSDWGAYALAAAIAYLMKDPDVLHSGEMQKRAMTAASESGMIDMYGWLTPAIDGFAEKMNVLIVELMREVIEYPIRLSKTCETWFEKVLELKYYDGKVATCPNQDS